MSAQSASAVGVVRIWTRVLISDNLRSSPSPSAPLFSHDAGWGRKVLEKCCELLLIAQKTKIQHGLILLFPTLCEQRPLKCLLWIQSLGTKQRHTCVTSAGGGRKACLPWLRVEVLFMSPEMKEDSDCFLTVSFHILLMRLWFKEKSSHWSALAVALLSFKACEHRVTTWVHDSQLNLFTRCDEPATCYGKTKPALLIPAVTKNEPSSS